MNPNGSYPTLEQAKERLPGAVLLPCNRRKHPTREAWQNTAYLDTQTPEYQSELAQAVAIGVLLGSPSGSLVVVDCDTEALYNAMLLLNIERNGTLVSRGQRGGSFWFYIEGNYPEKVHYLLVEPNSPLAQGGKVQPNGLVKIGEFRGACQSIVCGRHPSGLYYTWPSDRDPRHCKLGDIILPAELELPWHPKTAKPSTPPPKASADSSASENETVQLLKDAIAALSICFLWKYFDYPERRTNPVCSPFRTDHKPSFSIYADGTQERWYDHGTGEGGDSFDFYQRATGLNSQAAFVPFVELAGLGDRLHKNRVGVRTRKHSADKTQTTAQQPKLNKTPLILPCGPVPFSECAAKLFPILAKRHRFFVRDRTIVEIAYNKPMKDKQFHDVFQLLEPDAFRSRIEQDFRLQIRRKERGKTVLKPGRCTADSAKTLLKTDEAIEHLPPITSLSAQPVLTEIDGTLQILGRGYHEVHGGIYVTHGESEIIPPDLVTALSLILDLIKDFDFVTENDKSRCVASILSPALHAGRLLGNADFPIDIAEADQSQSGKTFRLKLISAIYGETPYIIANRDGGVGSLDESISSALIAGVPFIIFENFRGRLDSRLLETCLRGTGVAPARIPHRGEVQVSITHINWQLSSNGIESTRDLINRGIISRISKRPPDYPWAQYPEGNILAHVKATQPEYLAATFRIIQEWWERGRKRTSENRHDFTDWVQTFDSIVQDIFGLAPLMDGHIDEVLRVSDPALSWLRQVGIAVETEGRLDDGLLAHEIIDICQTRGIDFPGVRGFISSDNLLMYVGKVLSRIFRDSSEITIDRYKVRKETYKQYRPEGGDYSKHYYRFEKR
jgi:bifunctional DNA primase/polymerase-like protein